MKRPKQSYLVDQVRQELRKTEKQIAGLTGLLTEVIHQRPLLERIDSLQGRRLDLELQLKGTKELTKPQILKKTKQELQEFAQQWRSDLTTGIMEKRKAVFRNLIETATFDGHELQVVPSYRAIAGIKVASPSPTLTVAGHIVDSTGGPVRGKSGSYASESGS